MVNVQGSTYTSQPQPVPGSPMAPVSTSSQQNAPVSSHSAQQQNLFLSMIEQFQQAMKKFQKTAPREISYGTPLHGGEKITVQTPPPKGFEGYGYTSLPIGKAQLLPEDPNEGKKPYIAGYIPTPPIVGELDQNGLGNMFSPQWRSEVDIAVQRNGGLGNAEDGFLAFSSDGFVRLKNPYLSAEQNRRMAEISLMMGSPIEKMPAHWKESVFEKENVNKAVNDFIASYDKELNDFLMDPSNTMEVREGKRRFVVKFHEEHGMVASYDYKKKSGFRGFVQKHMKWMGPVLNTVGMVTQFIPGWGQVVSGVTRGLQFVMSQAAAGSFKLKNFATGLVKTAFDMVPGVGTMLRSGVDLASRWIRGGSIKARDVISSVANGIIRRVAPTGFKAGDILARGGLSLASTVIQTGKLGKQTITNTLYGMVNDFLGSSIGKAMTLTGKKFFPTTSAALSRVPAASRDIFGGIGGAVRGVGLNFREAFGDFGSGIRDIFSGNFSSGFKNLGLGALKTVIQTPFDAAVFLGGSLLSGGATLAGLNSPGRLLNNREQTIASRVFGNSINMNAVRLREAPALISQLSGGVPFVFGNSIYVPEGQALRDSTLVHELTHVWQYQNGGTDYISEALGSQLFGFLTTGDRGSAYQISGRPKFDSLNPEQQGHLVAQIYEEGIRRATLNGLLFEDVFPEGSYEDRVLNEYIR